MSDYLVCFGCHRRLLIAAMDGWLEHHHRCHGQATPSLALPGTPVRNPALFPDSVNSDLPELAHKAYELYD